MQNTSAAINVFNRVFKMDPANSELLDTFDDIIYEVFKEHDTVIEMYQKAIDIRPDDFNLVCKCIEFMLKYQKYRKADFAYGRACDVAEKTIVEFPERKQNIHFEYGKFLLTIRNQFERSNKHFLIAGKANDVGEIYEKTISDRLKQIEKENELIIQKHKESKAKGKPIIADASKDKFVHIYRKGYIQFLDKVVHDLDKAKEYVDLVLNLQSDHIPTLFVAARIEIEKNENMKSALANIQLAIDSGYYEDTKIFNILEKDELLGKIKENEDFKEQYMELLKIAKTPLNKRNADDGKKKGKKKKK